LFRDELFELGHRQRKLMLSALLVPFLGAVPSATDKPAEETSVCVDVCLTHSAFTCLAVALQATCPTPIYAVLIQRFGLAAFGTVFETHGNLESLLFGLILLDIEIPLSFHFDCKQYFLFTVSNAIHEIAKHHSRPKETFKKHWYCKFR
jgi:hypothetical protein